ncbi:MAG TPA: serine/threonine-protein kinase [Gemmatimonadales bacterium]|nr:serine/threonine-protein kinase [Gemmatimonadales bacterium]
MSPQRWRVVKALFDQALEQPTEAREQWLSGATGGDPELRHEVASLLLALDEEHDRFERTPLLALEELVGAPDPLRPAAGDRVGPYRLLRQVGQGGMGVVFEAYRDDDHYRKRVAIKTISRGMNSELILRRFRYERQILARLEHRNIAGLLDGGVGENGQPYFALEFVEGTPIDAYCAERGLPVRERLQLFRQVCGAVQYAHTNLVIHRDLKPSNILVTADGTVKLLDFGIAKLLREDDGSDGGEGLTQPGLVPLTTAYASPEQVSGEAVTTATDVFSLGLVLYKVLTARHPFAHDAPSGEETRRRIIETTPPAPSAVVSDRRLQRTLRGELDSIVLMALRKEPGRRYGSVEQLGEDLLRYLAGQPVAAQPDSAGYRLRKFVRRNRTAVGTGVLAFAVLLAGLGATIWQARVARQERDRARLERAKAERMNRFLQNMLGAADPSWYSTGERPGPQTTIGTIFDAAGRRAEAELAAQPEVLADVMRTLGRANQALRRLDLARNQLDRARDLHLRSLGPLSIEVASDEHELGMAMLGAGDFAGAERWMRLALSRYQAAGDTLSDEYGRTIGDLGTLLMSSGRPAEGEPLIRASARHRWRFDSTSAANAVLLGNLGSALSLQGKLDSAEPVYRAALASFDRLKPREYFEEGFTLGNLALDYINRGRPVEALPLAHAQIAHFGRLLGATHPNVGYGWVNLARALHATGQEQQALEAARRAEAIFKGAPLPAGHPDYARSELIQGQILTALDRLPEAERRLRNALAIRRARLAPGSTNTADVELALGDVLVRTRHVAEAESLFTAALKSYRTVFGPGDPRTQRTLRALANLCDGELHLPGCSARP